MSSDPSSTTDYPVLNEPDQIPRVFAKAWNRRDPETLASIFDEDADFVNVVGLWWRNRDAIREAHKYGLDVIFGDSALRVGRVEVKFLSNDIAVVHARMSLSGQTPTADTGTTQMRMNIMSFVTHRRAGRWSCASAHNTDVIVGAETNIVDQDGVFRSADYRQP